ncbi:MAG: hypothetical protein R8P61_05255 [Bacteroidia bacterium]|nr:hypothetical protein [Bacteroidia bacterium]
MKRRDFSQHLIKSVTSYALFDSLFLTEAFSYQVKPIIEHWALDLESYCKDLRKAGISPSEWQNKIEALYQKIELEELLRFIKFEELIKGFEYPDLGVATRYVKFPKLEGLPSRTAFTKKIFGMKKGRAIIPHGHANMSSAHLILKGEMQLRNYNNHGQEENHMIISPSSDQHIKRGDCSTISDERDNVHWFVANTDQAFTFDVIMLDLNGKQYDIYNLDMYEKEELGNGKMRVPILEVETALKKYGKESHH